MLKKAQTYICQGQKRKIIEGLKKVYSTCNPLSGWILHLSGSFQGGYESNGFGKIRYGRKIILWS